MCKITESTPELFNFADCMEFKLRCANAHCYSAIS